MNAFRKPVPLLVPAAILFFAAMAHAEGGAVRPPAPPAKELEETPVTSNSTGKTSGSGTIKEINAQQFEAIDKDNDDHINLDEFTSSPILSGGNEVAPGQAATEAAPRSDGSVLVKPVSGRNTPELFRRLDKDRDGYLDSVEIAAFYLSELED
jgi:hypothetical protein